MDTYLFIHFMITYSKVSVLLLHFISPWMLFSLNAEQFHYLKSFVNISVSKGCGQASLVAVTHHYSFPLSLFFSLFFISFLWVSSYSPPLTFEFDPTFFKQHNVFGNYLGEVCMFLSIASLIVSIKIKPANESWSFSKILSECVFAPPYNCQTLLPFNTF